MRHALLESARGDVGALETHPDPPTSLGDVRKSPVIAHSWLPKATQTRGNRLFLLLAMGVYYASKMLDVNFCEPHFRALSMDKEGIDPKVSLAYRG